MSINRGDIYYITDQATTGHEQSGYRPAVIVSNDICNKHSPVVEAVYLTTRIKNPLPTHVLIMSAPTMSTALCEQIVSIDKERLQRNVGKVTVQEMDKIDEALKISLGIGAKTMNEMVQIHGVDIALKDYKGKRVVTFKDIDLVHNRPEGTASRNFTAKRRHFISGVDFHNIGRKDVGADFVETYGFGSQAPSGLLITESGYLMIVKSLTDDLAWQVQWELVDSYFRKIEPISIEPEMDAMQEPEVAAHEPEVYLEVARILSGVPDCRENIINCLRHVIPDIDVRQVRQEMIEENKPEIVKDNFEDSEIKKPNQTKQRGFYKAGVPCDTAKLKRTMKQRNISIARMALLSGVTADTVRNTLDGKYRPTAETRTKYCKALQESKDFLTPY